KREATLKPINITSEEKEEPESTEVNSEEAEDSKEQEAAEDKASEPKADDSTDKKPKEDGEEHPETSTSGAIDALAGEASAKRQSQKQKEAEEKKNQAVQELIKSGKYHLPIHDAVYRRTNAFTLFINLLLVVLLLLSGIVLAQDAGYIDIGLVLPFDLIK